MRPLFTSDVELAKRWRARGTIMLDILIILLGALSVIGEMGPLALLPYFWVGVLGGSLSLLLLAAIGTFLDRETERRLKVEYDSMPRWKRRAFACTWWTVVAAMFLSILWFAPSRRHTSTPWTNLHCDAAATQMTAEACSPASAD